MPAERNRDPFAPAADKVLAETIDDALLFPRVYREYQRYRVPVDAAQLADLQTTRLSTLLRHACTSVPAYRGLGLRAATRRTDPMSVLPQLPPVSRDDLRTRLTDHCDDQLDPGECRIVRTSGTTGEPLRVVRSRDSIAHAAALALVRSERWGIPFGRKLLWPCHARIRDWIELTSPLHGLARLAMFGPSRDTESAREMADKSVAFGPEMLLGLPSQCTRFATMLAAHGIRLTTVRAVATFGAHLDPDDRALLKESFDAPVYDAYGLKEVSTVAAECAAGSLHLESERVVVEILDDQDRQVADGGPGEIAVTDLTNLAMPVIRYRTGDVGRINTGGCGCGQPTRTLTLAKGRRLPRITLPGGHQLDLNWLLWPVRFHCTTRFQVVRVADATFEVVVGAGDACRLAALRSAMDGVVRDLNGSIDVQVRPVTDATEFAHGPGGKSLEFLDRRAPCGRGLATDSERR